MALPAELPLRAPDNVRPFIIEEDSTLLKTISCIPVIGMVFSFRQEASLVRKIEQTADAPRLIELIDVKNQYKTINVARCLLEAALIVTGTALGIIGGTFAANAIAAALIIGCAGIHISRIDRNTRVIRELRVTGFRPGIQVV